MAQIDTTILDSHRHLMARLTTDKPCHIHNWHIADDLDFDDRAAHLKSLMAAVGDYVRTALKDIEAKANVRIDVTYLEAMMSDTAAEIVGSLENAADELRGYGRAA
jgi:hypothetical protein